MAAEHNKLQSQCFLWAWNEKPETRMLLFSSNNNLTAQLGDKADARKMAQMKALGVLKGVTDLLFFWSGRLYAFDIKIGKDKLSESQNAFISAIRLQGGDGCEIRSLDEFKRQIESIMSHGESVA